MAGCWLEGAASGVASRRAEGAASAATYRRRVGRIRDLTFDSSVRFELRVFDSDRIELLVQEKGASRVLVPVQRRPPLA